MSAPLITEYPAYLIAGSLSFLGCLCILVKATQVKRPLKLAFILLLLVNLSDLIMSFIELITPAIGVENNKCAVVGFTKDFAMWLGFLWSSVISGMMYASLGDSLRQALRKAFFIMIFAAATASLLIVTV